MNKKQNVIWFKCDKCGREAYCESWFETIPSAKVMCPFCGREMKLGDARIAQGGEQTKRAETP
jgi:hypothetical protein